MPRMGRPVHSLGAALKKGVELGAVLDDFPGSLEAGGYDEALAGAELPAVSLRVLEDDATARQAAELRLGVPDAPFAARARPATAVELLARVGEVVGDHLAGRAFDQAIRCRCGGLTILDRAEIDDVVHAAPAKRMPRSIARRAGVETGTFQICPLRGQTGTYLPQVRPRLLANQECPHSTPARPALSCWPAPAPIRSGSRRSARRPGRRASPRCWRTSHPWPRRSCVPWAAPPSPVRAPRYRRAPAKGSG